MSLENNVETRIKEASEHAIRKIATNYEATITSGYNPRGPLQNSNLYDNTILLVRNLQKIGTSKGIEEFPSPITCYAPFLMGAVGIEMGRKNERVVKTELGERILRDFNQAVQKYLSSTDQNP